MDHKIIEVDGHSVLIFRDVEDGEPIIQVRCWLTPGQMASIQVEAPTGAIAAQRIADYDEAHARAFIQSFSGMTEQQIASMDDEEILAMMERTFYGTAGQPYDESI